MQSFLKLPHYFANWASSMAALQSIANREVTEPSALHSILKPIMTENWEEYADDVVGLELCFSDYMLHDISLYSELLPWVATRILEWEAIFPEQIPRLVANIEQEIQLNRRQCVCLLGAAFFGFMERGHIWFSEASSGKSKPHQNAKRLCVMNYFKVNYRREQLDPAYLDQPRNFSITRLVQDLMTQEQWANSEKPLTQVTIAPTGGIEDYDGICLSADFANRKIGGGVLRGGSVQEEIWFVIHPELLLSCQIWDPLLDNEALILSGAERVNTHKGYSNKFTFTGDFEDDRPLDQENRTQCYQIAIDAIPVGGNKKPLQFKPDNILRDINKAYIGFHGEPKFTMNPELPIVTGKWGCGAFGGDPQLKFVQQWLAASEYGRPMVFCSLGDKSLTQLFETIEALQSLSVGELFRRLMNAGQMKKLKSNDVFRHILTA